MIDYTKSLEKATQIQNIKLETHNIPLNIYMKYNGDILRLCFLEHETQDTLIISETTPHGTEEIRIIPKRNIEFISIFYDFDALTANEKPFKDKMII